MTSANPPKNERSRLLALKRLNVLDSAPEETFDAIVKAAATVCNVPISLISLIDADRQWFKAKVGLPNVTETPREYAFCAHAILGQDILEVNDATADQRFADNPLVTNDPGIRFYSGAPLRLSTGEQVGTLCVIDSTPRQLNDDQRQVLKFLAEVATQVLEARYLALSKASQANSQSYISQNALLNNADYTTSIFKNSQQPIIALTLDGIITNWNKAAEDLFLYKEAEVSGQNVEFLVPVDVANEEGDIAERLSKSPQGCFYETKYLNKLGDRIDVSVNLMPLRDSAGKLIGATKVLHDIREQKRINHLLITSEAQFRALSETSPLGIFSTDAMGAFTYTNARWQTIFCLSFEESLGLGWAAHIHPDDRDKVLADWTRITGKQAEFDMEFRILYLSGKIHYVHARARPMFDNGGEVAGYVGSVEDITQQRLNLERLTLNEERLRKLYQSTPAMLQSIDAEGRFVSVSDFWLEKHGYSRDEVIGRLSTDFMTADSARYASEVVIPQVFKEGHCENIAYQKVKKSGEIFDVLLSSVVEYDEHNLPVRGMAVLVDVTAENAAKRETNALLGTIRSQFIMSITDANGTIIEVNDAFCAISQYSRDELLGSNHRLINSGVHPYAFFTEMWQTITAGRSWKGEVCNRAKDGSLYWVDSVISPLMDNQGSVERFISIRTDITERKLAELEIKEEKQYLTAVIEGTGAGTWQWNVATGECQYNERWATMLGYQLDELGNQMFETWSRLTHPDDIPVATIAMNKHFSGEDEMYETEFRMLHKAGHWVWIQSRGRVLSWTDDRQPVWMYGTHVDVTELRQLTAEIYDQHELLRVTLQSIGDAVITTDAEGKITWLNPVAERMTGWLSKEAKNNDVSFIFNIINESTRKPAESPVKICLRTGKVSALAKKSILISRDGREYGIEDSAAPIRREDGKLLGAVLVFRDVTEQRRLTNEMSFRATHDALTGLINRSEFESRLERVLQLSKTNDSVHAIMYIDLDQFKLINDACGHSAGDLLLKQVSKIFEEIVRSRDTLARLGGDEFAVILEQCTAEQAQRVAKFICERLDEYRFVHENKGYRVGASIGLAPLDKRWANITAVLQAADAACYLAKEAGRNRVHTWFDSDILMSTRHSEMQWATRLEQALDQNQFQLFAQRIHQIDAKSQGIYAEILLRLSDTNGMFIAPNAFLPAAERFHLISRIDRWVLNNTISWLQGFENLTLVDTVCVNLSGQSIGDRAFHRFAFDALTQAGNAICQRICLEITETATVTHIVDASIFIDQVRSLGVRIALDDFGAGASSFGYLKSLKVDILKIDGEYIKSMIHNKIDDSAVRCFVDVAQILGLDTVAEYVENAEILAHVKQLGIDYAQGYLIHKPQPIDALLTMADVGFDH